MITEKATVMIAPSESECLTIAFNDDPFEVMVIRHGMEYPEGGEIVYSELLEPVS